MGGTVLMGTIVILVTFGAGAMIGIIAIVSYASHREDRRYSLWGEAPDTAGRGVRRLLGVYVRGDMPDRALGGHEQGDGALGRGSRR